MAKRRVVITGMGLVTPLANGREASWKKLIAGESGLKKVDLFEISLVTFPANPKARIGSVKSGLSEREAERALRDAGFSRSEAKAIIADGFNAATGQRDAGTGGAVDELQKLLGRLKA